MSAISPQPDDPRPDDLIQGTLEMLILKTLALEPNHGYGVALRIDGNVGVHCGAPAAGDVDERKPGAECRCRRKHCRGGAHDQDGEGDVPAPGHYAIEHQHETDPSFLGQCRIVRASVPSVTPSRMATLALGYLHVKPLQTRRGSRRSRLRCSGGGGRH